MEQGCGVVEMESVLVVEEVAERGADGGTEGSGRSDDDKQNLTTNRLREEGQFHRRLCAVHSTHRLSLL